MDQNQLKKEIQRLSPWYQNITLQGIPTLRKRDTEKAWKRIYENFQLEYKGARILDLGCNAGYYSIMAAKEGASVIGIEAFDHSIEQANFLKRYYEELWNKELDVQFIHADLSDIDFLDMGKFDCIFALAILYHIGNFKYGKGTKASFKEQDRVISQLVQISDKFIVRARKRKRRSNEYYDPRYYNNVFKKFNFEPIKTINEKKGGRSLIFYRRF
jgi:cyclopropane fatty-acyl-phospholipid synthase-like methyltransferase